MNRQCDGTDYVGPECHCHEIKYCEPDAITVSCWNCGTLLLIRPDTPVLDEILVHPERHFFDAFRYRGHREGPSEYQRTMFVTLFSDDEQSFYYDYA